MAGRDLAPVADRRPPLVAIRAEGTRPPLFGVHPSGDSGHPTSSSWRRGCGPPGLRPDCIEADGGAVRCPYHKSTVQILIQQFKPRISNPCNASFNAPDRGRHRSHISVGELVRAPSPQGGRGLPGDSTPGLNPERRRLRLPCGKVIPLAIAPLRKAVRRGPIARHFNLYTIQR